MAKKDKAEKQAIIAELLAEQSCLPGDEEAIAECLNKYTLPQLRIVRMMYLEACVVVSHIDKFRHAHLINLRTCEVVQKVQGITLCGLNESYFIRCVNMGKNRNTNVYHPVEFSDLRLVMEMHRHRKEA